MVASGIATIDGEMVMVKYKAAIIGACAAVALAAAPLTPASAHSYHHGWPVFGLAALGAAAKRPLGVPCVNDRALQRSTAQVLSAIYEADFLPCSFGGRPERGISPRPTRRQ